MVLALGTERLPQEQRLGAKYFDACFVDGLVVELVFGFGVGCVLAEAFSTSLTREEAFSAFSSCVAFVSPDTCPASGGKVLVGTPQLINKTASNALIEKFMSAPF